MTLPVSNGTAAAATSRSAVNSTSASTGTSGSTGTSASPKLGAAAGMGKHDFMQLLIAQLQNQDPMKPMEDREFVTQLAQFSSLEALEKLTEQMEELAGAQLLAQGAAMIGKPITAKLPNGTTVTGVVSQVRMIDGKPKLVVNNQEIDPALITTIGS